jgi:hypothetical protein
VATYFFTSGLGSKRELAAKIAGDNIIVGICLFCSVFYEVPSDLDLQPKTLYANLKPGSFVSLDGWPESPSLEE